MILVVKKFKLLICLVFVLAALEGAGSAEASFMYLQPSGGNMAKGVVFPVQVRLSAQTDLINSVSVYLNYPSDILSVEYIRNAGSFPLEMGQQYGNGSIALTRQNASGIMGDVNIVTIGFKPKVSNTTATIYFTDGIMASLSSGNSTLDTELTKSRTGNYNILETASSLSKGGTLPVAGSEDVNYLLGGLGFLLVGAGIIGLKKFS